MKNFKKAGRLLAFLLAMIISLNPATILAVDNKGSGEEDFSFNFPEYQDNLTVNKGHFSYFDETKALLVGETSEGKLLFEKNSDTPLGIASMSKLMTYYIIKKDIRDGKLDLNQNVTVSLTAAEMNVAGSSNYGLKAGEVLSVEKLLAGMMVVSGNDAARQLAELVSGSEEAFKDRMNQEAMELGMTKTNFVNASGFTEDGKFNTSSARDMFKLCFHILKEFPEIKDYIKMDHITEPERQYDNKSTISKASVKIPGITGLKTGVTGEAGFCFAGSFNVKSTIDDSEYEIISLVMGAPSDDARWRMTKELVDLTAGSFANVRLVDASVPVMRYEIPSSIQGSVVLYPAESLSNFSFANKQYDIRYSVYDDIKAPTEAEQKFGEVAVYDGDKIIKIIDLVSHAPTEKAPFWDRLKTGIDSFFHVMLSLI